MTNLLQNINRTVFCTFLFLALQLHAIAGSYDKALSFIENKGQITDQHQALRNDIDFGISTGAMNIFIGSGQIHYQWSRLLNDDMSTEPSPNPLAAQDQANKMQQAPIAMQRLDVELVGANKHAPLIVEEEQAYYENHFLRHNGEQVTAHTFNKITYKNVYPNIDWVLYTQNGQLKYDFIVHPGGDAKMIKLQYNGADKLELQDGALTAYTAMGNITEQAPYSYLADTKTPITSAYKLNNNILSFELKSSDKTIVIDPTLEWATYYGGGSGTWSTCNATDLMGNVYMGGLTNSVQNIASSGAYQDTLTIQAVLNYSSNGFIVKFNISGARLWGTYFPGTISDIVTTNNGDLYFTGRIDSILGLATPGAHQDTFAGRGQQSAYYRGDAYLAKFSSSGSRIWFTYYGGEDMDMGTSVALDKTGYIYMGGSTNSFTGIATQNSFQDSINYGIYDPGNGSSIGKSGFLAKFSSTGVRQWATYYNGSISDIEIDLNGNIYCTGNTWHDSGVATTGAFLTQHLGNFSNTGSRWEAFLVKFASTGARIWGTYYGGLDYDWGIAVECDQAGNVYMAGTTSSTQLIATTGAHQTTLGGYYDAYLVKFSPAGVRSWGTYLGGSAFDWGVSLVVTPSFRVFISGKTNGTNGISTGNAYQTNNAGNSDDYIVEFDTAGVRLYGTYFGGAGEEYNGGHIGGYNTNNFGGDALAYNYTGRLQLPSCTSSPSGIATQGAYQTSLAGTQNAYLATFIIDTIAYFVQPFADTILCAGDTVRIPYNTSYPFRNGNVFTMQLSNASGSFASAMDIGARTDTVGDTIVCVIPPNTPTGTGYRMRIRSSIPNRTSEDNVFDIKIYNVGSVIASNNGALCAGDSLSLTVSNNTQGVTYSWTGVNSFTSTQKNPYKTTTTTADSGDYVVTATLGACAVKDTTTVVVYPIPAKPTASSNTPVCPNTTLNLYASHTSSGISYSWTGPSTYTSTQQNPSRNNATYAMAGQYIVTATKNGCTSEPDTANVVVAITTPTPQAGSNSPVCAGQQIIFTASSISNATYSWHGPNNYTATQQNPSIPNATASRAGTYYVKATVNGCESLEDSVTISVAPPATVNIFPTPSDSICDGQTVSFVAITNNAGSNPTYSWLNGGSLIPGATSSTYSSNTLSNGAAIQCIISNIASCPGHSDTGNMVVMTILPVAAPSVSITSNPNMPIAPFQLVTFTAQTTYGGNNPTFQWMRNGQPVIGATSSTWGTYQLSNGDSIYTILTGSYKCAEPDTAVSNTIQVLLLLSVDDVNQLGNVTLYPNPNNGTFTIKGKLNTNKEISINVMNAIGQSVYRSTATPNGYELNHTVNIGTQLAAGTYLLHLQSGDDVTTLRFTIQQ